MDYEKFDAVVDSWALDEEADAEKARMTKDERALSITLMKKSMYSTMLKTLGHNAPHALKGCARDLEARREKMLASGDADAADRISIQLACISRVQALIAELGGNI